MAATLTMPFWEQYTLTIEEAAVYFRIGENKLRNLIQQTPHADWILRIGNRTNIKRRKFEQFIDTCDCI